MERDKYIDFDCEFYKVRTVDEGDLNAERRTTESVIYHLCTFYGEDRKHRCDLRKCPKKLKK